MRAFVSADGLGAVRMSRCGGRVTPPNADHPSRGFASALARVPRRNAKEPATFGTASVIGESVSLGSRTSSGTGPDNVGAWGEVLRRSLMRRSRTVLGATSMSATLACGLGATPPAQASPDAFAINGVFTATSDGNFATTDYAFHNEATVTSTWTVTSTCISDDHCAGQVSSDQGWSAPLYTHEGHVWYVERDLPAWEPCPDGTTSPGHQRYKFSPSNADGLTQIGSPYLEGTDKTNGVRGACGRAKWLTVVMPFRLNKVG